KLHMLKRNISLRIRDFFRRLRLLLLLLFIKKLEYTFSRSNGRLNNVSDISRLHNRLRKLSCILYKGLNVTYRNISFCHLDTADYTNQHVADITDKAH